MNKWNKRLAFRALSFGFIVFSLSNAGAEYNETPIPYGVCYDDCDCCLDLGVDFILWKPGIDDLEYAVKVGPDDETIFHYRDICPNWEPGFRIRASKPHLFCDWGLGASYTYLYVDKNQKTKEDPNHEVFSLLLHPGIDNQSVPFETIRAKYNLNFNTFDVLLFHPFCSGRCHVFTPFFGLDGIGLSQEINSHMRREEDSSLIKGKVKWDSSFFGVGFKFGTEYIYKMFDCFHLYAKASGSILAGDADSHYEHKEKNISYSNSYVRFKFKDDTCCQFLNGYHIQLGATYQWDLCGFGTSFKCGYEFLKYHNVPTPRRYFVDDGRELTNLNTQSTETNITTLGFHGFLAGLDIEF